MKLFIHFGLYKTGSSYLQTLCANNRSHLEEFGYFFPTSDKDADMMAGRITPGNGNGIASFSKNGNIEKCYELIKTWCKQAQSRKCYKILISDEALIHGFANENGLTCLYEAAKINNIESVSLFAFFRNPIDHCLSTYKHRAKRGGFPDFNDWVTNHYETPLVFKSFLNVFNSYPFEWKFAKYNRSENVMANYFFDDWLKIPVPPLKPYGAINSSLTIAEIIFIQISKIKDPKTVLHLYREFSKIGHGIKASNNSLDTYYHAIASNELCKYADVFEQLNSLIFNNERIEFPTENVHVNKVDYNIISYSNAQLDGIIAAFKKAYHISSILGYYKDLIVTRVIRYLHFKY